MQMDQLNSLKHGWLQKDLHNNLVRTYFETFASTIRHTTIRTILALAAIDDMELRSVDISHAFTNSDIDAEVYMRQPEGFEQNGSKYVCRLDKSLYGLKQSPRL